MKKNHITVLVAIATVLLFPSCKGTSKTAPETEQEETLPEDIVELRQDQINVAGIQTGSIEKRSLSGTLKVSGTVCASPQSQASVCVPMGGFIKKSYLIPGNAV
ncbi:MAG: efflux transporter periplasmic adaptor subunit, partial [Bacteroidota bacterium]|nr:efflux transporter periplasmic adaptor subunit [Bacteroidota bacterium]